MPNKAKHAFGSSANIDAAINAGTIDAYDILFLDGETSPKIGWIDKNGQKVIVESEQGKQYVVPVEGDSLPAIGEEGVIYIFNDEGYIWNGTQFVSFGSSADLSVLEEEIATKVDESVVDQKIESAVSSAIQVVEF